MLVESIGKLCRVLPHFRGKGRIAGHLIAPFIRSRGYEVVVGLSTRAGGQLICNLDDWIPWNVYLFGSYRIEQNFENFMLNLARGASVICDIGANIGYYTVQYARLTDGLVHAFEPMSYQSDTLARNIALNDIQNVRQHKLVISDEAGVKRIFFSGIANTGSSSLELQSEHFEDVPSTTFDRFAMEHDLDIVDIVKIDVEGHELHVLKGMAKSLGGHKIKHLFVEINTEALQNGGTSADEICQYLAAFGYEPRSIKTGMEQPYSVGDDESLVYFHHHRYQRD